MEAIVIEYMLREGYIESSKQLIEELNIDNFVDLDVFLETDKIATDLRNKKCASAIRW